MRRDACRAIGIASLRISPPARSWNTTSKSPASNAGHSTSSPTGSPPRNFRVASSLKNTDVVMNQTFWLGTFPALGEPQLNYIADKLEEFFGVNF